MARANARQAVTLPRPSTIDDMPDVADLVRDPKSHVVVSDGGRDRGPEVRRGINGGKRLVHDSVERVDIQYEQIKSPTTVTRVVDTLASLHNNEAISDSLYNAGIRFQDAFDRAHLETMPSMRLDGMPSSGKATSDLHQTPSIIDARTEVFDAMKALGGWKGACGVAVLWIVGMRWSLRQLAGRETIKRVEVWTGVLTGALGVLDSHYAQTDSRARPRR